ncbi:MAG: universal stress protein [Bacteroidales bacterium]|nr:universal stress protein [Bacteroidales bacterium]
MNLNNLILVPTDFSEVCKNAVEYAIRVGEMLKFDICIYHVINKESEKQFGTDDLEGEVEKNLISLKDEFAAKTSLQIQYAFEEGSIFDLIHHKAEMIGANLIVLGTHGKKGMQRLFGSFALKVITRAQVPTLVVQKKPFTNVSRILFPVNTFTEARQKVNYAITTAKVFDAEIVIYKELVKDPSDRNRIEIITKQIVEAFKKEGVKYSVEMSEKAGESAKLLIAHAVEKNMDLIMIVTEPQVGSSQFSVGPWNEKIMFNEAQIPVLCINPIEHSAVYFDL